MYDEDDVLTWPQFPANLPRGHKTAETGWNIFDRTKTNQYEVKVHHSIYQYAKGTTNELW